MKHSPGPRHLSEDVEAEFAAGLLTAWQYKFWTMPLAELQEKADRWAKLANDDREIIKFYHKRSLHIEMHECRTSLRHSEKMLAEIYLIQAKREQHGN